MLQSKVNEFILARAARSDKISPELYRTFFGVTNFFSEGLTSTVGEKAVE